MSDFTLGPTETVLGSGEQNTDYEGPACILFICRTCPRSDRQAGVRLGNLDPDAGAVLAARLKGLLHPSSNVTPRQVDCLSGCLRPCNVRLSAHGKTWLRFNGLAPEDAPSIAAFAMHYNRSMDGGITPGAWPPALRAKLAASMPRPSLPRQGGQAPCLMANAISLSSHGNHECAKKQNKEDVR